MEAPMGPGGDLQSLDPTACGPQCGPCVHQLLSLSQFGGRSPGMLPPHRGGALTQGTRYPAPLGGRQRPGPHAFQEAMEWE